MQAADTAGQPRAAERADEGYDETLVRRVTRPCQCESLCVLGMILLQDVIIGHKSNLRT